MYMYDFLAYCNLVLDRVLQELCPDNSPDLSYKAVSYQEQHYNTPILVHDTELWTWDGLQMSGYAYIT